MNYQEFLNKKVIVAEDFGFEPQELSPKLHLHQPCCNFHNLELERNPELSQKYQLSKITGKEKLKK